MKNFKRGGTFKTISIVLIIFIFGVILFNCNKEGFGDPVLSAQDVYADIQTSLAQAKKDLSITKPALDNATPDNNRYVNSPIYKLFKDQLTTYDHAVAPGSGATPQQIANDLAALNISAAAAAPALNAVTKYNSAYAANKSAQDFVARTNNSLVAVASYGGTPSGKP